MPDLRSALSKVGYRERPPEKQDAVIVDARLSEAAQWLQATQGVKPLKKQEGSLSAEMEQAIQLWRDRHGS